MNQDITTAQVMVEMKSISAILNPFSTIDFCLMDNQNLGYDEICTIVLSHFNNVSLADIRGRRRTPESFVFARFTSIYFIREFLKNDSYKTIGKYFSGRDHSSIMHAISAVNDSIDVYPTKRKLIENIRHDIKCSTKVRSIIASRYSCLTNS